MAITKINYEMACDDNRSGDWLADQLAKLYPAAEIQVSRRNVDDTKLYIECDQCGEDGCLHSNYGGGHDDTTEGVVECLNQLWMRWQEEEAAADNGQ